MPAGFGAGAWCEIHINPLPPRGKGLLGNGLSAVVENHRLIPLWPYFGILIGSVVFECRELQSFSLIYKMEVQIRAVNSGWYLEFRLSPLGKSPLEGWSLDSHLGEALDR